MGILSLETYSMKSFQYIISAVVISTAVSGCATPKMPNIDFLKLPEFREIVKNNQTNVPKVSEVPSTPEDVRRAKKWDEDAVKLLEMRDNFTTPESLHPPLSQDEITTEFEQLRAKTQAYKLDDPE